METFGPLVDAQWLVDHQHEVHIFDSRSYMDAREGKDAWASGHIPGAVFADLGSDVSAPPCQPGGRHPFPHEGDFATAMSRLGYDGNRPAVIYDDVSGGIAARLWFMLHIVGCQAAVLDGGIHAWTEPLSTDTTPVEPVVFEPRPWPAGRLISADEVVARLESGGVVIDARNRSRFIGKENRIDDRFGHIPGAISLPWEDNIDDLTGRMLDLQGLADRFAAAGAVDDGSARPVVYCGSGVTACHNLLAMELLDISADLYVGSWSEWGADLARPVATGVEAGS